MIYIVCCLKIRHYLTHTSTTRHFATAVPTYWCLLAAALAQRSQVYVWCLSQAWSEVRLNKLLLWLLVQELKVSACQTSKSCCLIVTFSCQ